MPDSAMATPFSLEHLQKMEKGLALFNEQKYWECHEDLEHWWLEDVGDHVRNVYWAVIQVAAAMIHYRNGNLIGARGLIIKAKEKFGRCEQFRLETPLLLEKLSWKTLKEMVYSVPAEPQLSDFEALFQFRFPWP